MVKPSVLRTKGISQMWSATQQVHMFCSNSLQNNGHHHKRGHHRHSFLAKAVLLVGKHFFVTESHNLNPNEQKAQEATVDRCSKK